MNTDKIAIVGDDENVDSVRDVIREIVARFWVNVVAQRKAGFPFKYSIGIGFNLPYEEVVKQLPKVLDEMLTTKILNTIEIVDGNNICKIHLAEFLRAEAFDETVGHEIVTFQTKDETGEMKDQLEPLGRFFRGASPLSIRGKSGIKQSMVLAALHSAFGMESGIPRPSKFYNGNNAATTILGNIGRKKYGGKK